MTPSDTIHAHDVAARASSILGHGLNCAIEVDEGRGWEPRLMALRSSSGPDVVRAIGDLLCDSPRARVRLAAYDGRLRRVADLPAPSASVALGG